MKKSLLFICMLSIVGLYAQQGQIIIQNPNNNGTEESEQKETITSSRINDLTRLKGQYESMIKRGKELTAILIEHDKLIQEGSMTKKQIKNWKRDVLEAKLLNYRIEDFTNAYLRDGYSLIEHLSPGVISDYYNFSKKQESSSKYAGF